MPTESSFADFVRDRGATLYRYGYVLTGNAYDADDLVQDALIRVRAAWHRVDHEDPVAYVRTTMARLHVSKWRRRRREWLTSTPPDREVTDAGLARVVDGGTDSALWRALATLPPRQRAVLVLRYYEHLTDAEIADVLDVSAGTIRSQASRALDKLRAYPLIELIPEGLR